MRAGVDIDGNTITSTDKGTQSLANRLVRSSTDFVQENLPFTAHTNLETLRINQVSPALRTDRGGGLRVRSHLSW